jgi:hypothetical protein
VQARRELEVLARGEIRIDARALEDDAAAE